MRYGAALHEKFAPYVITNIRAALKMCCCKDLIQNFQSNSCVCGHGTKDQGWRESRRMRCIDRARNSRCSKLFKNKWTFLFYISCWWLWWWGQQGKAWTQWQRLASGLRLWNDKQISLSWLVSCEKFHTVVMLLRQLPKLQSVRHVLQTAWTCFIRVSNNLVHGSVFCNIGLAGALSFLKDEISFVALHLHANTCFTFNIL